MATKPVTTDVGANAQYNSNVINNNFAILEEAIENCLGRGGTSESPNSMTGDLDADLNKIQNLPTPTSDKDAANKAYVDGKVRSLLAVDQTDVTISKSSGSAIDWDAAMTNNITCGVETYTELRNTVANYDGDGVALYGRISRDDGGGGIFYWDSSDLSTEVTADTESGIYVAPNTDLTGASGAWVRKDTSPANVKWFGATGDGSTDDATAMNAALTYATGKTLYVPEGTYRCESQLIGYTKTKWIGIGDAIIDFSQRSSPFNDANFSLVEFRGTAGSYINLTADADYGENKISVPDASVFSEGDLVEVSMNAPGSFIDSSIAVKSGQLNIVTSVFTATNNIVLDTIIFDTLTTANTARIRKITPVEDIVIDGLTFKGVGRQPDPTAGDFGLGIYFGKNVTVRNCKFIQLDYRACTMYSCYKFLIDNCYDYKDPLGSDNVTQISYSFVYSTSMYGSITNNYVVNARHGIVSSHTSSTLTLVYNGVNRFVTIAGNTISGNYGDFGTTGWDRAHAGISTHTDAEYLTIDGNVVSGCKYGINPRSRYTIVSNNILSGNSNVGVYLTSDFTDITITGNQISDSSTGIFTVDSGYTKPVKNLLITNNNIQNCTEGITLFAGDAYDNHGLLVSGNTIRNLTTVGGVNEAGISIENIYSGAITNNVIMDNEVDGILINSDSELLIQGNTIINITNATANKYGMRFKVSAPDVAVINNYMKNCDNGYTTGSSNVFYGTNIEV